MKVSYTVIPSGDLASQLHFRVVADENFDPDEAVDQIQNYPTTQPTVVSVHEEGALPELIAQFAQSMKERFKCLLTLVVSGKPAKHWHAFDRVTLRSTIADYAGIPANEIHFYFNPDTDFDTFPVVAPLGAHQTHVYAWTDKERVSDLVAWARRAPYQIGIINKAL